MLKKIGLFWLTVVCFPFFILSVIITEMFNRSKATDARKSRHVKEETAENW